MSYHRCVRCSSDQVMDGVYIADSHGDRIVVGVERHPDRGPLERSVSTGLHASVCGSCGFIELWANKPGELYDMYHRAELKPPEPAPDPADG